MQLQAEKCLHGGSAFAFCLTFLFSSPWILINGEFRPWSSSARLWLLSSCKQQDEIYRPKHFTKFFFFVKFVCGSPVPLRPQSGLHVIIFSEPWGYLLHFTVTLSIGNRRPSLWGNFPRWQKSSQGRKQRDKLSSVSRRVAMRATTKGKPLQRNTSERGGRGAWVKSYDCRPAERFVESTASGSSLKANNRKTSEINNEVVRMRGAHKSHEDHNAAPPATRFPREESGQT